MATQKSRGAASHAPAGNRSFTMEEAAGQHPKRTEDKRIRLALGNEKGATARLIFVKGAGQHDIAEFVVEGHRQRVAAHLAGDLILIHAWLEAYGYRLAYSPACDVA